ncbi:MAG: Crp/Fnr family transcriptional regulator [Bacteroidetes bacterium]|jgi:CRP-like cAMP-binding protein|nr:Crp/Fnr family transcriptional regulator [Bacteroidota bacterium]
MVVQDSEILESYRKHVSSFASFGNETWKLIESIVTIGTLNKGDISLQEGKVCSYVDFLYSGSLRAFSNRDGSEITTGIYLSGKCVTNMKSLSTQTPSSSSFQASEDTIYARIHKEHLTKLYEKSAEVQAVGRALLEAMVVEENDWKEMYTLYDPEERYMFLMKKSPEMLNRVPLQYVASFLGIRRETLSRIRKRTLKTNK